jgi:hypothetical protein
VSVVAHFNASALEGEGVDDHRSWLRLLQMNWKSLVLLQFRRTMILFQTRVRHSITRWQESLIRPSTTHELAHTRHRVPDSISSIQVLGSLLQFLKAVPLTIGPGPYPLQVVWLSQCGLRRFFALQLSTRNGPNCRDPDLCNMNSSPWSRTPVKLCHIVSSVHAFSVKLVPRHGGHAAAGLAGSLT